MSPSRLSDACLECLLRSSGACLRRRKRRERGWRLEVGVESQSGKKNERSNALSLKSHFDGRSSFAPAFFSPPPPSPPSQDGLPDHARRPRRRAPAHRGPGRHRVRRIPRMARRPDQGPHRRFGRGARRRARVPARGGGPWRGRGECSVFVWWFGLVFWGEPRRKATASVPSPLLLSSVSLVAAAAVFPCCWPSSSPLSLSLLVLPLPSYRRQHFCTRGADGAVLGVGRAVDAAPSRLVAAAVKEQARKQN